jgi:hypothetical protein
MFHLEHLLCCGFWLFGQLGFVVSIWTLPRSGERESVCAAAVVAWLAGSGVWWLVGGVGLVVPVTLVVTMPTNRCLASRSATGSAETVGELRISA